VVSRVKGRHWWFLTVYIFSCRKGRRHVFASGYANPRQRTLIAWVAERRSRLSNNHAKASTNLARSDVEQTLGTCYAHAAAQLALHAWRRSGTLHVPAYGDLIHTIVTAHGCSGQDPLAAIATLSGFTRDLGP
jgi:hypothetical protein